MQQAEAIDLILQLTRGYLAPRCLHVVANLGIADHIGESARSLIELAEATATNPDALARTLGLLATQGVFAATGNGYEHTAASRLLRSDTRARCDPLFVCTARISAGRRWGHWSTRCGPARLPF